MTTVSGKRASKNTKSTVVVDTEREFSKIKEGIKHNKGKIIEFLRQRVGPGDWELTDTDVQLEEDAGTIDMVFSTSEGKKEKYILVDVSVPHLGVGQKYLLPTQAKIFQKTHEVPATRIKKAIILVRKGTETLSIQSLKIRCPIIEIQIENILKTTKSSAKNNDNSAKDKAEKTESSHSKGISENISDNSDNAYQKQDKNSKKSDEQKSKNLGFSSLSDDLLYALKEAIVHESLSTSYKRNNKYIRRGLWHWIEREIMDPNVHFFLIILSSIYQSKTGEILSKKYRTIESYIENPENIINSIFSRENALADEIKKNAERHKKTLTKFLGCFSQMPPFEYLKSLFLKEFRSSSDGLKARMSVYTTLEQLLARCGFEGEKEINYPLEILDELKIFQGVMCGNYETLRTDNASKKLKHLVPQIEWEADDIYALRDQLSKILNLPSAEFNLNAYLPQAFVQDARNMAETRKEALRQHSNLKENRNQPKIREERPEWNQEESISKLSRQERMALQKQAKLERQAAKMKYDDEFMPKKHHQQDNIDMPMLSENGDFLSEEAIAERNDREKLLHTEMDNDEVKRILDDPYAFTTPTSKKSISKTEEASDSEESDEVEETNENELKTLPIERDQIKERRRSRYADVDESRHRHFENFGGIDEEDPDVIKLSLALARHEDKEKENEEEDNEENIENRYNSHETTEEIDDSIYEEAPTKTMVMQGYRPSNHSNMNNRDNRRQNFHRHQQNNDINRSENRNGNSNNINRNRNNNRNNRNNNGYRDQKKFYSQRNSNNNNFRRRPRRDSRE